MKKILMLIVSVCLLASCTPNEQKPVEEPMNNGGQVTEEKKNEKTDKIIEKDTEKKDVSEFELLGQYNGTMDGGETEACISLYTSAMRDKRGNLMWDDTQEWILTAETADGSYTLYDGRINGRAYMSVFDSYGENSDAVVINLHLFANTSNEIREYRFENGAFVEKISYTTDNSFSGGIGELYNSVPQYK